MKFPYRIHPNIVFRSPLLPLPKASLEEQLVPLLKEKLNEAIYLASPDLFRELQQNGFDQNGNWKDFKLKRAAYKYALRSTSRSTPFGLFAGVGLSSWGNTPLIRTGEYRRTRLDMSYLCSLGQQLLLHPFFIQKLPYYPNDSIYASGNKLRYVEYTYVNSERSVLLNSVETSSHLSVVLEAARTGKKFSELAALLTDDEISEAEAEDFIHELIVSRLLVTAMEPNVTGKLYQDRLCEMLDCISETDEPELQETKTILLDTISKLKLADERQYNNIDLYIETEERLKKLPVQFESRYLFQTDLFFNSTGHIDSGYQPELRSAIQFLSRLTPWQDGGPLKNFRDKFIKRYETREVSLNEALDQESGIGFGEEGTDVFSPLIQNFQFRQENHETEIHWNRKEAFLHQKLTETISAGQQECVFTDEDVSGFPPDYSNMPDSIAVFFKVINASEKLIRLHNSGGSTATMLFSRFAHGNESLEKIGKEIAADEQKLHEEAVIAELVYLPENRTGNILIRPVFHSCEICYLTRPGTSENQAIPVSDLRVSVRNNRIILRSESSGRQIIPRLSSAHNYISYGLPVYRFLAAMQHEQVRTGIAFQWGALAAFYKFLPRARYGQTILFPASWKLNKTDFPELLEKEFSAEKVNAFRNRWRMPPVVALMQADNMLPIRFDNETSMRILIDYARRNETLLFEEYLEEQNQHTVCDEAGNGYASEFVAFMIRESGTRSDMKPAPGAEEKHPRIFFPGSEWAFYKIYCGRKTADEIIVHVIKPVVDTLQARYGSLTWFWIRYNDPDEHIRFRIQCSAPGLGEELGRMLNGLLANYAGKIASVQTDTYQRETERYGSESILIAESLFCIDSNCTLGLLENISGDEGEIFRWKFGLLSVLGWFDVFNTGDRTTEMLQALSNGMFFQAPDPKAFKVQADQLFREKRQEIEQFVKSPTDDENIMLLHEWIAQRNDNARPYILELEALRKSGRFDAGYDEFIFSVIHMSMNRLHRSHQNLHEQVTYDLAYRFLKSDRARRQKTNQP